MKTWQTTLAALTIGLGTAAPASAVTFILDFDSAVKTSIFGDETGTFDETPFGFSSLTRSEVIQGVFDAVVDHFLGYVTSDVDSDSPLAPGFELDIDFLLGTVGGSYGSLTDYHFVGIGPRNPTDPGIVGRACLSCVRNAGGAGPTVADGSVVGSTFTEVAASLSGLASSDQELINLIAGTTSHEIGHTLSLEHAGAQDDNPGPSAWGVMGSGATAMPNDQRVLEREFTYAKFGQLIGAVGVREADISPVPLPASLVLLLSGLGALSLTARRRKPA